MKTITAVLALAAVGAILVGCKTNSGESSPVANSPKKEVKIGFIVKSMSDSWFQNETRFAKEKAEKLGVKIECQEALKGEDVLTAINTFGTNGFDGIIICSPNVQLGSAIQNAAKQNKMKLMSVDDRLVSTDNKPITEIPHLGISAKEIGKQVGQAIVDEMKKRGWKPEEVAGMAIITPSLETATQRIDGAKEVLKANGFIEKNIFNAPWTGSVDVKAASDAASDVLTTHSEFKKWVIFSSNDDGVLGGVRAMDIIGVGINGALAAAEWAKGKPSGMVASVLLQPKRHGGDTVQMMYDWITTGKAPAPETYTSGTVINKDNYKEELTKQGIKLP